MSTIVWTRTTLSWYTIRCSSYLIPVADSAKVDEVVQYIDWAVANKFAVMDVNVPSYEDNNNVSPTRHRSARVATRVSVSANIVLTGERAVHP